MSPSTPLFAQSRPRDVQIAEIGPQTQVLRSRTWERLKFEIEYARQRGTTSNAYLIQSRETALIDPPGESFTETFIDELYQLQYLQRLHYLILSHINPNRLFTLKRLLDLAPYAKLLCSKPAANTLRTALPDTESRIQVMRDGEILDLGDGHELTVHFVPTPRWPDAIALYDAASRILFSDKLFGVHVCGEEIFDEHWREFAEDRRYYFDCLHASQAPQVEAVMDKILALRPQIIAPAHGPLVRHSLSRLSLDYRQWIQAQQSLDVTVALLYTSAYGNTATLGRAIAKGLGEAGAAVSLINCEYATPEDITRAVADCDGFIIGSPTLGGHAPTQIQTALGIVLTTAEKTKLGGVFGSFGWSGEAVDLIEGKLLDAGYRLGFATLRVKFTPTAEGLSLGEKAGAEFVQAVKRSKRATTPRQMAVEAQSDRTSQAVGRVTGALCVLTGVTPGPMNAPSGDEQLKRFGMLTSWVSQAGFNPPALTVSVPKLGFPEQLAQPGATFVLNILKEGKPTLPRHFQKPPRPGEDRFAGLDVETASNGCPVLQDALAFLEGEVQSLLDCGDHWLLYATTARGKVLESTGATAINHRKSGQQY